MAAGLGLACLVVTSAGPQRVAVGLFLLLVVVPAHAVVRALAGVPNPVGWLDLLAVAAGTVTAAIEPTLWAPALLFQMLTLGGVLAILRPPAITALSCGAVASMAAVAAVHRIPNAAHLLLVAAIFLPVFVAGSRRRVAKERRSTLRLEAAAQTLPMAVWEARVRRPADPHASPAVTPVGPDPLGAGDDGPAVVLQAMVGRAEDLFGRTIGELLRRGIATDVHPEDRAAYLRRFTGGADAPASPELEYRYRHGDGRWVWLRDRLDLDGEQRIVRGVTVDVSAVRANELDLRRQGRIVGAMAATTIVLEPRPDALPDEAGRWVVAQLTDPLGLAGRRPVVGLPFGAAFPALVGIERTRDDDPAHAPAPDRRRALIRALDDADTLDQPSGGSGPRPGGVRIGPIPAVLNGRNRPAAVELEVLALPGGARAVLVHDVTEREEAAALLRHQASHDSLTGLHNRAALHLQMEDALRRRGDVGLVLIDLNDFKGVNDTLGHQVGDAYLRVVGGRLAELCAPGEVAVRLGGDEFAVLAVDPAPDRLDELAERIVAACRVPVELGDLTVAGSASAGVVSLGDLPPGGAARARALPAGRRPAALRRPGDVPGQGHPHRHLPVSQRHGPHRRAAVAGGGPARRLRTRRAGAAPATEGGAGQRSGRGCRGPRALAPPGARRVAAVALLGPADGVRLRRPAAGGHGGAGRGGAAGAAARHRSRRQRHGPQRSQPPPGHAVPRGPRGVRGRPGPAHHRDHREPGPRHQRRGRGGDERAGRPRCAHRGRRLRHRLLVADPPARPAAGRAEDRPPVRRLDPHLQRGPGHRAGDDRARPQPRAAGGRRRGGGARGGRRPARAGCDHAQGYLWSAPRPLELFIAQLERGADGARLQPRRGDGALSADCAGARPARRRRPAPPPGSSVRPTAAARSPAGAAPSSAATPHSAASGSGSQAQQRCRLEAGDAPPAPLRHAHQLAPADEHLAGAHPGEADAVAVLAVLHRAAVHHRRRGAGAGEAQGGQGLLPPADPPGGLADVVDPQRVVARITTSAHTMRPGSSSTAARRCGGPPPRDWPRRRERRRRARPRPVRAGRCRARSPGAAPRTTTACAPAARAAPGRGTRRRCPGSAAGATAGRRWPGRARRRPARPRR
ncbi:MAG: GGDEF domain-containing protein [Acidimicrobiales bacterium]